MDITLDELWAIIGRKQVEIELLRAELKTLRARLRQVEHGEALPGEAEGLAGSSDAPVQVE